LLVGHREADDAAVVRLSDEQALVQTVDFFTPIVDDPYDFGRVAAANALSDVFAMGGEPIVAVNIVCFPTDTLDTTTLTRILQGGCDTVHEAGALLGGGHTIADKELKYGLAVTGTVHPDRFWRNGGARPGDQLFLTKPLGTGILATLLKKGQLDAEGVDLLVSTMATLNAAAARVARSLRAAGSGSEDPVHAVTDITGFGLLGHALEMAKASGVQLQFDATAIPVLNGALPAAVDGVCTGGGRKNREHVGAQAQISSDISPALEVVLADPQTSGGLLLAVDPSAADDLQAALQDAGTPAAARIGEAIEGPPGLTVS